MGRGADDLSELGDVRRIVDLALGWNSAMADAGIGSDVVRHTLRHTASTRLRIAGVDVRAVADLLGMSIQTVVRIYVCFGVQL